MPSIVLSRFAKSHVAISTLGVIACFVSGIAGAQPPAETRLHLADAIIEVDQLKSIDDQSQFTFQTADGVRQVPANQIVRFGTRQLAQRFPSLMLTDGSILAGSWLGTSRGAIRWDSNIFGTLDVPLIFVRGIRLRPVGGIRSSMDLQRTIYTESKADRLLINSAGWTQGIVRFPVQADGNFDATDSGAIVELKTDSKNSTVALEKIQALVFSSAFAPDAQSKSTVQLGFRDETLLKTRGWTIDSNHVCQFQLAIPFELSLNLNRRIASEICYIESAPARCLFLSSQPPASFRHIPQWTTKLGFGLNETVLHEPIVVRNQLYERGLAMPGSSQASYRLDRSQRRLIAEIAVPDSPDADRSVGSVIAKVLVSRNRQLQTVYASEKLRAGEPPIPISVDVSDCELVVLLVDPADRGDAGDQLIWLDVRLTGDQEKD